MGARDIGRRGGRVAGRLRHEDELTAQVAGTFDVASGVFRATSTSLTGTGLLRGVSGGVTLEGLEDFATLRFTETITGRLCLD